ncbi:MAG: HTTM domain-containing protein [Ekhidna sp.]|nr:HTTM domain-containing protein [Ekhidna sp.]
MLNKARLFLGTYVDNSPLVVFRIFFGLLITAECIGAVFTGWVHETFILPKFTFTVIGLEWLQPFSANGMIYYFLAMGLLGILIALGLFYRASTFAFTGMWTIVYVMQKSHYNNHYYLLILLSAAMFLLPAHKAKSLDVHWKFTVPSDTCQRICHWFFIIQILIVYCYASIHKMNPDWAAGKPLDIWFAGKSDFWMIGPLLDTDWMPYLIAWGGIIYDGSITFLLLFRKTRKIGFILSIVFNLFNSAVFHIGIFPYLMILLTVFFYPPETVRNIFFKKKPKIYPIQRKLSLDWTFVLALYFLVHLTFPLRHHFFKGQPSWTEEGHRLAWRMMLRSKSGPVKFNIVDKETGLREQIKLKDYLIPNQISSFKGKPDMIWQFAQYLKKAKAKEGKDVAVFVEANISLNGHPRRQLIDSNVDLAAVPWEPFKHAEWILTYE